MSKFFLFAWLHKNHNCLYLLFIQELYKDKTSDGKLEFVMKDDFYSLTVLNPNVNDMGKYTLVVKDGKETYHTGAYLDVKGTEMTCYIVSARVGNKNPKFISLLLLFSLNFS